jgi:hypothetical protein
VGAYEINLISSIAYPPTNYKKIGGIEMNIELIKQFAEICEQLKNEPGYISFFNNEIHVNCEGIKGMENIQIEIRSGNDYPYKIFTEVEGIKIFAIAKEEELSDFPQFREFRKAELKRKIALLEAEEEALA